MTSRRFTQPLVIGLSMGLHIALVAGARSAPKDSKRHQPPLLISIDVTPPPPVAVPPPEPPKREPVRQSPAPRSAEPPKRVEEPAPDVPVGVAIAVDPTSDRSWLAPVGEASHFGPARAPRLERAAVSVERPVRPPQPAVVSPGDLSERLRPPGLDRELERAYPADARQRGIGGTAVVRARIGPEGTVRSTQVLTESFPGFGTACQQTLIGSRWSVPRDRNGHAVTTEIRYTCRFVVGAR